VRNDRTGPGRESILADENRRGAVREVERLVGLRNDFRRHVDTGISRRAMVKVSFPVLLGFGYSRKSGGKRRGAEGKERRERRRGEDEGEERMRNDEGKRVDGGGGGGGEERMRNEQGHTCTCLSYRPAAVPSVIACAVDE
jgi:hypothetical protein